jgi:hypothetical protein
MFMMTITWRISDPLKKSAALLKFYDLPQKSMPRGVKKGVSGKKFDRTVRKIKRSGGAKNPYAVANATLGRKKKKGKKSTKRKKR